ncbi:MAG: V-type ATP synthase subunit E [Firmicutes bacterium]|nr:V-type ATP synthase subunit E [Bacillota bacterium]
MAGVKDLTAQILQDAKDKAQDIIAEAEAKASEVEQDAYTKAALASEKAKAKAAKDADDYAARIRSQIGMMTRQRTLKAKQDIIEQVIAEAYEKLRNQDDASYFSMITALVKKNAHAEDGEILFGSGDLNRLPAGYETTINAALEGRGTLRIVTSPAPIEDGFVLRYGGIEENCTLKALFADKQEALSDKVHQVLFSKA